MAKLLSLETSEDTISLFCIGKILKAHGIKGKLKVNIIPELLPFMDDISSIFINNKKYDIISFSVFKKNSVIICVKGIESLSEAERLVGYDAEIDKDLVDNEQGNNLFELDDLVNFEVIDQNENNIGKIKDFYKTPHFSYIELNNEKLIPFIKEHILSIDKKNRKVFVNWNE